MHILLMTHRFFPKSRAGTEVLTLQLGKGLTSRGYRVTVLTGEMDENLSVAAPPSLSNDTYEGLTTFRLHYGKAEQTWRHQGLREKLALGRLLLTSGLDPVRLHIEAPNRVEIVRDLVTRLQPDLVHINHVIGFSAAVVPAIRGLGLPVMFTPTDYFAVCPTDQLLHRFDNQVCAGPGDAVDCVRCLHNMPRWVARFAMSTARTPLLGKSGALFRSLAVRQPAIARSLNAANRIMPSTHFLADVLVRHGVDKQRVRVVPYGIDIGELPPMVSVPERFDSKSRLRIGFIGKLESPKGPHVLVEAVGLLGDRRCDVQLDIYAAIDPKDDYTRSLMNDARRHGESIRFSGTFQPDEIGRVLRGMHVLVVPSIWYESIPLVLRSALNAGVPVIVSEMGGLTEPLQRLSAEARRMSFTAGDSRQLSGLFQMLLDDPVRLSHLRTQLAGQERTLDDYLDDVQAEYQAIVAPRRN